MEPQMHADEEGMIREGRHLPVHLRPSAVSFQKDPADRVVVATARLHGCTLLSADRLILDYPHVSARNARTSGSSEQ
jgi:hypothetical protein